MIPFPQEHLEQEAVPLPRALRAARVIPSSPGLKIADGGTYFSHARAGGWPPPSTGSMGTTGTTSTSGWEAELQAGSRTQPSLFSTAYHKRLEDDLSSDTSGHFKRILVSLALVRGIVPSLPQAVVGVCEDGGYGEDRASPPGWAVLLDPVCHPHAWGSPGRCPLPSSMTFILNHRATVTKDQRTSHRHMKMPR